MSRGTTTLPIRITADAANARAVFAKFGRDIRRLFKQLNLSRGSGTPGGDLSKVIKQVEQVAQGVQKAGKAADVAKKKTLSWTAQLAKARAAYGNIVAAGADPKLIAQAEKAWLGVANKRLKTLTGRKGGVDRTEWQSLTNAYNSISNATGASRKLYIEAENTNKAFDGIKTTVAKVGTGIATAKKKTISWTAQLSKSVSAYKRLASAGADPVLLKKAEQNMQSILSARAKVISGMGSKAPNAWINSLKKSSSYVQNLTGSLDSLYLAATKQNKQFNQMARMGRRLGLYGKDVLKSRASLSANSIAAIEKQIKEVQGARDRAARAIRDLRKQGFKRPTIISDKVSDSQKYPISQTGKWGGSTTSVPARAGLAVLKDKDVQLLKKADMLTRQVVPRLGRIREFFGTVRSFMKMQLGWFAAAGIIFALARAFSAAVKSSLDFYQSLKDIQAITGVTDKAIGYVSQAAIQVARTTPIAANEAAKMGLKLIQAGLSARETAEAMKTVAAITTVSGESMEESSKAVTTAMFAWKLTAKDIPDIGNKIAAAMNFSRLTVEDLSTSFNYLAATSSIMGRSLTETVTNMSVISNMGVRASTIGTGLRQLYARLLTPTRKFSDELERLAANNKSVAFSFNDINPAMTSFANIVRKLTELKFSGSEAFEFLGARAGNIMATGLVATAEAFDVMYKKIDESTQLSEGLKTAMEGPINALKLMRNEAGIAAIEFGSVLVPTLVSFTKVMKALLSIITTVASGVSALASVNTLFALSLISAVPAIITARRLFKRTSIAMSLLSVTTMRAASSAKIFFKVLKGAAVSNPYLLAIMAIVTVLGIIGAAFSKARRRAQEFADQQRKIGMEIAENKKREIARREAEQRREAKMMNDIRQRWESTAIIRPKFAVVTALTALRQIIAKTRLEIEKLKKDLKDLTVESRKKDMEFFSLSDYGAAAGSGVIGSVVNDTSPEKQKANADLERSIKEKQDLILNSGRKFLKELQGTDIAALSLADAFEYRTRTGVQRVLQMYQDLSLIYKAQKIGLEKLFRTLDKETDPEKRAKISNDIANSIRDFKAETAERINEILNVNQIVTQARRRGALAAKASLGAAQRGVKALMRSLKDLESFNPFRKIRDRASDDIEKIDKEISKLKADLILISKERVTDVDLAALNAKLKTPGKSLKEALALLKETNTKTRNAIDLLKVKKGLIEDVSDTQIKQNRADLVAKSSVTTLRATLDYLKTIKASKKEILEVELELLRAQRARLDTDKKLQVAERGAELAALKRALKEKEKRKKQDIRATTDPLFAMNLGFTRAVDQWMKTSDRMREIGSTAATSLRDSFSNIFFDGMQGELTSFRDYWDSFWKSLGKVVSDMLAEMLVKFIRTQTSMAAAQYKGGGGGGGGLLGLGLSFLGSLLGGVGAASTGAPSGLISVGNEVFVPPTASLSHTGGMIPRLHSGGLADDERLAILQTGEYVINRKATQGNLDTLRAINGGKSPQRGGGDTYNIFQIKANDAKSFDDMVRRNPRSITSVVDRDLRLSGGLKQSIQAYA